MMDLKVIAVKREKYLFLIEKRLDLEEEIISNFLNPRKDEGTYPFSYAGMDFEVELSPYKITVFSFVDGIASFQYVIMSDGTLIYEVLED